MATYDTIIRGGRIVDGTGCPAFYGDIGISDGRIAAIGNLARANARDVIDASGKIVAPGHVNQHSHYDVALFWDPYCSNAGENGVTTVLNANCGFGLAPVRERDKDRTMQMLETTEQIPVAHQRAATRRRGGIVQFLLVHTKPRSHEGPAAPQASSRDRRGGGEAESDRAASP